MIFKFKNESYSYALYVLYNLFSKNDLHDNTISNAINKIKIAIENHEQDSNVVVKILQEIKLCQFIDQNAIKSLNLLINALQCDYKQATAKQKYLNPLARRFESEIAIGLLQSPTASMMIAVKAVSDELLKFINSHLNDDTFNQENLESFAHDGPQQIDFGAFQKTPSIQEITQLLQDNDLKKIIEILHIHFRLAYISCKADITTAPNRMPIGELKNIIGRIWKQTPNLNDFFTIGLKTSNIGYTDHISGKLLYNSSLYRAPGNRGRDGACKNNITQQMGLMLSDQINEFAVDFPQHESKWVADCQNQQANLQSQYVLDLINNDAVYVAGFSGMASLFLNQMEIVANLETEDLKKNYVTAVMSYIVGGGFHSIHEVLGPAQYALKLIPKYSIQVPTRGKLASPPNYHQFFMQQEAIDPEFSERREQAWNKYLKYFATYYVPKYLHDLKIFSTNSAINQIVSEEKNEGIAEIHDKILEMQQYIDDFKQQTQYLHVTKNKNYHDINKISQKLQFDLNFFIQQILKNPDATQENLILLKDQCIDLITRVEKNFKNHRGWGRLIDNPLVDILKSLLNIIIGILKSPTLLYQTRAEYVNGFFLRTPLTKSAKLLNKLQNNIESINTASIDL